MTKDKNTDPAGEAFANISTHHKLLMAQMNLQYILKDSRNEFAKYDYVSADAYIGACRQALNDVGLALTRCFTFDREDMTVAIIFTLMNPTVGERDSEHFTIVMPVVARTGMPEDKATLAAVTTGTSYFLQGLFMLPRLDSAPELDQIDDKGYNHNPDSPLDEATHAKVDELRQVLASGGMEKTIKELTTILRGRAKDGNQKLDAAFVSTCIDKAKGLQQ